MPIPEHIRESILTSSTAEELRDVVSEDFLSDPNNALEIVLMGVKNGKKHVVEYAVGNLRDIQGVEELILNDEGMVATIVESMNGDGEVNDDVTEAFKVFYDSVSSQARLRMTSFDDYKIFRQAVSDESWSLYDLLVREVKENSPQELQPMIASNDFEAFCAAVKYDQPEIYEDLWERVVPHECGDMICAHNYEPFRSACANGDLELVQIFYDETPRRKKHDAFSAKDYGCFRHAASGGHHQVVEFLLNHAGNDLGEMVIADNAYGISTAITNNRVEVTDLILQHLSGAVMHDLLESYSFSRACTEAAKRGRYEALSSFARSEFARNNRELVSEFLAGAIRSACTQENERNRYDSVSKLVMSELAHEDRHFVSVLLNGLRLPKDVCYMAHVCNIKFDQETNDPINGEVTEKLIKLRDELAKKLSGKKDKDDLEYDDLVKPNLIIRNLLRGENLKNVGKMCASISLISSVVDKDQLANITSYCMDSDIFNGVKEPRDIELASRTVFDFFNNPAQDKIKKIKAERVASESVSLSNSDSSGKSRGL